MYNSLSMTSGTVQTVCLVTVNATLHFVSFDPIVVASVMVIRSSNSSSSDSNNGKVRQDEQTLTAQFEDIIQAELDANSR